MRHSQITDDLLEKASLYASGAMPEDERSEYVRHFEDEDCAVCRNEVAELQSAVSLLAVSLPSYDPSPELRPRLVRQARESAPARAEVGPVRWVAWITGLAAVAASTLLVVVMNDNTELRRLTGLLSARVAELQAQLDEGAVLVASLTSPDVRVVNLAGQGATPAASGRIFWDQAQRRWLFYVRDLPPAPADRSFQLWFVPTAGNPISGSVFNTQSDGSAVLEVPLPENLSDLRAAAVTTEPAGGVPQPTGPFALLGAMD